MTPVLHLFFPLLSLRSCFLLTAFPPHKPGYCIHASTTSTRLDPSNFNPSAVNQPSMSIISRNCPVAVTTSSAAPPGIASHCPTQTLAQPTKERPATPSSVIQANWRWLFNMPAATSGPVPPVTLSMPRAFQIWITTWLNVTFHLGIHHNDTTVLRIIMSFLSLPSVNLALTTPLQSQLSRVIHGGAYHPPRLRRP
ncbi:hypothetical protein B0T10DRAFT_585913 [Thelonectria olida]|uniref:Secreted protein n=1 Tax=Thelonectria olida TaxID=1576542 RepID=A0A9P9AJU2_9HYPO|nr:hypothetical protein B0T10DRAFT_585913 [Thelonectria olida]